MRGKEEVEVFSCQIKKPSGEDPSSSEEGRNRGTQLEFTLEELS